MFKKKCSFCKKKLKNLYLRDCNKYLCPSCARFALKFSFLVGEVISSVDFEKYIKERSENK